MRSSVLRPCSQQSLDVLGQHVDLDVDGGADAARTQRRTAQGLGDEADADVTVVHCGDGETDAVERDGSLDNDVTQQVVRDLDRDNVPGVPRLSSHDVAYPV